MEELYETFKQIIKEEKAKIPEEYGFVWRLMNALEDYFKHTGKQGGDSTRKKHPNHHKEAGKKGARNAGTSVLYDYEKETKILDTIHSLGMSHLWT